MYQENQIMKVQGMLAVVKLIHTLAHPSLLIENTVFDNQRIRNFKAFQVTIPAQILYVSPWWCLTFYPWFADKRREVRDSEGQLYFILFSKVVNISTPAFQAKEKTTYMYHKHGPKSVSWCEPNLQEDVSTTEN